MPADWFSGGHRRRLTFPTPLRLWQAVSGLSRRRRRVLFPTEHVSGFWLRRLQRFSCNAASGWGAIQCGGFRAQMASHAGSQIPSLTRDLLPVAAARNEEYGMGTALESYHDGE